MVEANKGVLLASMLVLLQLGVTSTGYAQTAPAPPLQAFGLGEQILSISGLRLMPQSSTAPLLFVSETDYSVGPDSQFAGTYYAEISLSAGARLKSVWCDVYDANASLNVAIQIVRSSYNTATHANVSTFLASDTSTGSGGYQAVSFLVPDEVIRYEVINEMRLFVLRVGLPPNTRFRSCRLTWQRTVSAPPGGASFADVPVGHPLHQFVEALVAAGVTGGCGGGNYCPNAPLTRGQMAVFLGAALGLHWPN